MTTETVQEAEEVAETAPAAAAEPINLEAPPLTGFALFRARVRYQLDRGPRGWIRDWLRITSDNRQIVAYSNGLRADHDALVGAYRKLALQHRDLTLFAHETQRRLRWHEVGPLRPSKVKLDKKDQELQHREARLRASQNGDNAPDTDDPPPGP